jgi:bacterioferritin-associated ferredoxin
MIVCHCMRVNDRQIRSAVESGAHTVARVAAALGAASCCGGCAPAVAELVARYRPLPVIRRMNSDSSDFIAAE